jgi:hypothetical protein
MLDSLTKKQLLEANEFLFEVCSKLQINIRHSEFRKRKKMELQPLEI